MLSYEDTTKKSLFNSQLDLSLQLVKGERKTGRIWYEKCLTNNTSHTHSQ